MAIQYDFSGGLNLVIDSAKLAENEYAKAFNIRNRYNTIDPILEPLEDTDAMVGKKQGIYAFDKYVVVFISGIAYYKDITTSGAWTAVAGLMMDPLVDRIYTCAVPASTINYVRKLIDTAQISGNANNAAVALDKLQNSGTPGGLVVQDGINQPWIILPDASARKLQKYEQWSNAQPSGIREYVPIMRQMTFFNGILFGISPDGKLIYRSASGRPLDFVVNVDVQGNKGGKADTTSYAASFGELTFIGGLDTGELLVATNSASYRLELDYNNTQFAEPQFLNRKPYASGIVNQFSLVNILNIDLSSDYYFVDTDGIRAFSTSINQNEGRNTSFSAKINKGLALKQSASCAIVFDNYTLLSVKTLYDNDNNFVAIYDNNAKVWVCFDNYGIGTIKQFAVANQSENPTLYAITDTKVYRMFGGSDVLEAEIWPRSTFSGDAQSMIRMTDLYCVFTEGVEAGTVIATEYSNGYQGARITKQLKGSLVEQKRFNFHAQSSLCWRVQPKIAWQNASRLLLIDYSFSIVTQATSVQEQSETFST